MLTLILTEDDVEDLTDVVGTINVMTQEGVEVVADSNDFTKEVWHTLNQGEAVTLDMEIIGQRRTAEVTITK